MNLADKITNVGEIYGNYDDFCTPSFAIKPLLKYIPKNKIIWECAEGYGHITNYLRQNGYEVISSSISDKNISCYLFDFLKDDPNKILNKYPKNDIVIVTNPPYSLKRLFVQRAVQLDFPFAFLIPLYYSKWLIDALEKDGVQKLVPKKRINFITPSRNPNSSSHFHSFWLTRYFNLERDEIFVDIKEE